MERLRAQFETNVFGLVRMCQLVLGGMRRAGRGRIVNISSMGGKLVFPGGGAYHASKYAVEALSDALRFEVRGFGIRVVIGRAGPDHHQLRRDGGRLAGRRAAAERRERDRPVRGLQRRGRRRHRRRLRGPDEAARRRAGHGREDDRARDLLAPPASRATRSPPRRGWRWASARCSPTAPGTRIMRSQFPSPGS